MKAASRGQTPISTRQAWLDRLGRRLTGYFPAGQILDILSDYAGRLEEARARTRSEEAVLSTMDTPEEAAERLLEEEPLAAAIGALQAVGRGPAALLWGAVDMSGIRRPGPLLDRLLPLPPPGGVRPVPAAPRAGPGGD